MTLPELSQSEWQVMNVIWDNRRVTASDIIKTLSDSQEWTPATIRTFLHRLVKKGAITYEEDGNRYIYRAVITRRASVNQAGKSFLRTVFSGETGPLITHFVQSSKLSPDEIQQLRELLDRKDSK